MIASLEFVDILIKLSLYLGAVSPVLLLILFIRDAIGGKIW